jgi:hypothetical protein
MRSTTDGGGSAKPATRWSQGKTRRSPRIDRHGLTVISGVGGLLETFHRLVKDRKVDGAGARVA